MSDRAVVVGISAYPGLRSLQGPCHDARRFRDWLVRPDGGGLTPGAVRMLLTDDFPAPTGVDDAHPVVAELDDLFRPLVKEAALQNHVDGRLFIFVAGHGFADSDDIDSAALLAANAEALFPVHLAVEKYAEFFRRTYAFRELILVMDACRTTNPLHEIGSPPLPAVQPHPRASRVKYFRGYGASFNHVARERAFNGGTVQGIFTMAFLDALESARPNQAGRVNGTAIKRHIHNRIAAIAGDVAIAPPDIAADEDKDVFFVHRAQSGIDVAFTFPDAYVGHELVVEFGDRTLSGRFAIDGPALTVPLAPGLYKVYVDGTDASHLIEVPHDGAIAF
ncbi:MAG: caspase family protein [Planctomycetota bacterium]